MLVVDQLEIVIRQPGKGDRVVPLRPGEVTIGRGDDNTVVLPDIGVSRRHARLLVGPGGVTIDDLSSGNGTWCRGQKVEKGWAVHPGDILVIDPFSLELRESANVPTYTPSTGGESEALARLDVVRGPSLAQASYFVPSTGLTVGRSEFRDLVVLDPAASRHHCDLVLEAGEWRLVDRGSSNGVHLNERRVTDSRIHEGDIIRIGNTELRFQLLDQPRPRAGRPGPTAVPHTQLEDWAHDLSLPIPVDPPTHPLDTDATPAAQDFRDLSPKTVPPPPPPMPTYDDRPGDTATPSDVRRRTPWMAMSLGALSVALLAVAATVALGVGLMMTVPRSGAFEPPAFPEPHPPTWTLKLPAGLPSATVGDLFDEGVAAMREKRTEDALQAFYRVLLVEPGNRSAERWSFTAGEHLMLNTLQQRLDEMRTAEAARVSERDALLADFPKRRAAKALREAFRDDPVVLSRTGWAPSSAENALAGQVDEALEAAESGDPSAAVASLGEVLRKTQHPVIARRARFAQEALRRSIALEVALQWRRGVNAQLDGDLDAAREAYQAVLTVDPRHTSSRIRLRNLGGSPPPTAEVRP